MNIVQKNVEDFEIQESISSDNANSITFLCSEKYSGEKLVMKKMFFKTKQDRLDAIRQIQKYQFLDATRSLKNQDDNDSENNYSIYRTHDYPENNFINKYKYYAIDQRLDTIDLMVFQDPMQQSLQEKIQKKSRFEDYLSSKEMKCLVKSTFSALEYMDNKSLAHFNLKPSNILFSSTFEEDYYKVSDYGFESTDIDSNQIWEVPEIIEGENYTQDIFDMHNYETFKEAQKRREFNSLNPDHADYDPIKFDVFRLGLILIQAATFISNEELQCFKYEGNVETQSFKDEVLETIKQRYDNDLHDLIVKMINVNHILRPYPSSLKKLVLQYLQSKYVFLGGPQGKGPQENLNKKICSEIYQRILNAIMAKKKTPELYFLKYDMNRGLKTIQLQNFERAIRNLQLSLTPYEYEILIKSLQSEKYNVLQIQTLIDTEDSKAFTIEQEDKHKIKIINQQDEQTYVKGILELNKELNKKGILLSQILEDKKRISIEFLEKDDFNFQFKMNQVQLPEFLLDLIYRKFNINNDGLIACQVFIDDFIAQTQVSDDEYLKVVRQIFHIIREKYLTLENFFKAYDNKNQKYILESDFQEFLEEACFVIPEKFYSLVSENLLTNSDEKIYLLNLYQFFNQIIADLLKTFFNRLIKDLQKKNINLQRIFQDNCSPQNHQLIQIEKVGQSFNVLTNDSRQYIKQDELAFILNLLGIRKDIHGQINFESACQKFYEWCEENDVRQIDNLCDQKLIKKMRTQKEELQTVRGKIGLLSSQLASRLKRFKQEDVIAFFRIQKSKDPLMPFQEFNQKIQVIMKVKEEDSISMFKHLDKLNIKAVSSIMFLQFAQFKVESFEEEIETKLIKGMDAKIFNRHQNFIEEIISFLEEKNETIDNYFASDSGYVHNVNFRYMLMDLDINLTFFKDELNDLITTLSLPSDPNNINIELFRDIMHHFYQLRAKKNALKGDGIEFENIHFAIQWFIQIYGQLNLMNLTFEKTFLRYEERNYEITLLNMDHVIFNTLKLKRDYAYIFFQKFVQKDKEYASLLKIKQGLEKEEFSLKGLKEITQLARQQSISIDQLFLRFNTNHDSTIDIQEFREMAKIIHPTLPDEVINHIFLRIDLSGDGYITAREFKTSLFGAISESIQEDETQFHTLFIEEFQIALMRQNLNLEDYLKDINFKGIISISDFLTKLNDLGYDIQKNKLKIDSLLSRIKKDENTIYFLELKSVYLEYKKDEAELRRKGLITEQEEKSLLAYGQLIRREMQRNKHTFDTIFKSKKLKNSELITEQQVRNYLVFDLELNDDAQMKSFFEHLKRQNLNNVGNTNTRSGLVNLDDLERLIYGYKSQDDLKKATNQQDYNVKLETLEAKKYAFTLNQSLLDELIQFIAKNNYIRKELDEIDSSSRKKIERRSGQVTAEEFKKVLNEAGRYARLEDVVQLANYFGCNNDGIFFYKRLLEEIERETKIRHVQATKDITIKDFPIEFKQFCIKLKKKLNERGINVIDLVKKYYKQITDNWIYESDLWYAFKVEQIQIEYEQTKQLVQSLPYRNGKIDYKIMNELIFEHFKEDNRLSTQESNQEEEDYIQGGKKVRMIINEDVRDLFREIRKEFQQYMGRENIPLLVLFKRLDIENDDYISFSEFIKGVSTLFPNINLSNLELVQAVFNKFDKSHDTYIDFSEFKAAVLEDQRDVQVKPLLRKIKNVLDLKTEEEMKLQFEKMDTDKSGTIAFGEFSQALKEIDFRFTQEEIQALFEYFDKEDKKHISYHQFISMLNDGHLDFLKIREKIFEYLKNQNIPMEYFFKRYVMDQQQYIENSIMNFEQFKKMMRDLSFHFDQGQLEELFCYLDENKDFTISIDEFKSKIFECKIDINKALRGIRRAIIQAEFDIEEAMKSRDIHKTGTIPYHVWVKLLKQYGVEIKPIEMEAIFKFFSNNKEKELDYIAFINGMISQVFNIEDIQEKILKMCKKYKTEPDKLFELFDEKKDGMLDLHEFAQMLENLQIFLSNDELKEAYQVFDLNKDGQINSNEFRAIIEGKTYSNKMSLQQLISQNYYQKQKMNYNNIHNLMQTTNFDPKAPKQNIDNDSQLKQVHIQTKQKGLQSMNRLDSMVEFQNFSPGNSEVGSPLRSSSIVKFKVQPTSTIRREGLEQFNLDQYIKLIVKSAQEDEIPIFQLFSQHDEKKNFKFYITGVQKIFQQLRIDADEKHIGQFFQSSTLGNDGCFYYIPILKKILQPPSLLQQILLFSIKANNLKPQQYFQLVRENSNSQTADMDHWSLGEIIFLNQNMNLDLDRMYLQEAWNSWLFTLGNSNTIDVKDFIELLGTEAIIMGGEDALSEVMSETELKKASEEIFSQLKSIYIKFGINLHDIFTTFDVKKDYTIDSVKNLQKALATVYIQPDKNQLDHFYNAYKDNTGKFRYILLLKYIQNLDELFKSILIFIIQANKLSYKSFFETLKNQENRSVYWGVEEFVKISKTFNFQFTQEELEELVFEWGKKMKGKLSIFDLAVALNLSIDISAKDIEAMYKERVKKIFSTVKDYQRDIKQSLEQQQQIMSMHFGTTGNFDESEKIKINQYVNELSQYINDHNFFDPFESMAKNGQLNFNDVFEALRNGYSIFQTQEDIKLLARWLCSDGPILISELSRLLKYDKELLKKKEEREKEKIEKINQGINIGSYVKEEVNVNMAEQTLADLIATFKRNTETIISIYFGEKDYIISANEFVQITTNACSIIDSLQAYNLFNYIDVNHSGTVTKNEMLILFGNAVQKTSKEEQYEKIRASKDVNKQIEKMFVQVDKDNSGFVDYREFDQMLRGIGIFCSQNELLKYFALFDTNKDSKISFDEFKSVVSEKLMEEVMSAEEIVEDLRMQFKKADINNTRLLNKPQLGQVFQNLGVILTTQDLNELFKVIDADKSGTIDIDEFLYFVSSNGSQFTGVATNVLLNIRSAKTLNINDMKSLFSNFPSSFQISFTRKKNKKRINLPSSTIKPILNNYDIYEGFRFNYKEINNRFRNNSLIDRYFVPHKLNCEIKFDVATGIPIPKDQIKVQDIVSRHVYISFFDTKKHQIFGNSCRVPVKWDPNYEDRWNFKFAENLLDNSILVRHANYDQIKDMDIMLCFEFVISVKLSNQKTQNLEIQNNLSHHNRNQLYESFVLSTPDFEVSCCYGTVPLYEILKSGSKTIKLNGGTPIREIDIDKQDVSARRSGWRSVVKAVTGQIKTTLKFEISRSFPDEEIYEIAALPDTVIIPKKSLSIIKSFREYAIAKSIKLDLTFNTKMHSLIEIKTFQRCVDCPDILYPLSKFWKETVLPFIKEYKKELDTFASLMQKLNLVIQHKAFRFNNSDPTATYYSFPLITNSRKEMLDLVFKEFKEQNQLEVRPKANPKSSQQSSQQSSKPSKPSNQQFGFDVINCYETFNISDILSDDEDSDFDMLETYYQQKDRINKTQLFLD
ncbi:EF hand protein (macronuclear) [Tetrahymena thermophila SB210]|uniref:EF hand protein n=1 Tax=Tetrahymena thermophila (strain SB210) TaxID=312017 RepID=I7MAN8_TETTS|nr:EF hand protein [Tetrahymena thermophila SB210]EAS04958.2 EF hand protein [Tetrahymena thermophila SB210]|eukprot:XP_001025203.2 EF hand protein [Tetrahymena thermophila SB210]